MINLWREQCWRTKCMTVKGGPSHLPHEHCRQRKELLPTAGKRSGHCFWGKTVPYLYGRHFSIHSDYQPFTTPVWRNEGNPANGSLPDSTLGPAYKINYCPWKKLSHAEALSRLPLTNECERQYHWTSVIYDNTWPPSLQLWGPGW